MCPIRSSLVCSSTWKTLWIFVIILKRPRQQQNSSSQPFHFKSIFSQFPIIKFHIKSLEKTKNFFSIKISHVFESFRCPSTCSIKIKTREIQPFCCKYFLQNIVMPSAKLTSFYNKITSFEFLFYFTIKP